jgi:hypothetical protein
MRCCRTREKVRGDYFQVLAVQIQSTQFSSRGICMDNISCRHESQYHLVTYVHGDDNNNSNGISKQYTSACNTGFTETLTK